LISGEVDMDLERYTQKAQAALIDAQHQAREMGHASIEPEHLLLALLRQPEGVVPAIVTQIAGSPAMLLQEIEQQLEKRPTMVGGGDQPGMARSTSQALAAAEKQAAAMKDEYVSTAHCWTTV
jgi:ATP-dependent Clp protease ATP-binding subunit ClpB